MELPKAGNVPRYGWAGDVLYRSNAGRAFTDTFTLKLRFLPECRFSAGRAPVASSWITRAPGEGTGLVTLYLFSYYSVQYRRDARRRILA